jgi:branched-chain amino acid transport system permease protein
MSVLADPTTDSPTTSRGAANKGLFLAVAAVVLLAPFALSGYHLFQLAQTLTLAIGVLGLNLLVGYNGQISLGHGAFYAIGAYATAILMDQFGWPYWTTIPMAGAVCLVFGCLFGLPALRLEGHYLALATFALALVMPQLLKYKALEEWTGGVQGIVLTKPSAPFGLPLSDDAWLYYFTLAIAAIMFLAARNILIGRIGRAMVAIRDQPVAASAMGVNTAYYKTMTFGVSGLFTGVAGSLSAIGIQFVAPDSYGIFVSISFLVAVIVGGVGTVSGALIGAVFIQFVPNLADAISKSAPWAVYGVFLIASVYLMPTGAVGLLKLLRSWWARRGPGNRQSLTGRAENDLARSEPHELSGPTSGAVGPAATVSSPD